MYMYMCVCMYIYIYIYLLKGVVYDRLNKEPWGVAGGGRGA